MNGCEINNPQISFQEDQPKMLDTKCMQNLNPEHSSVESSKFLLVALLTIPTVILALSIRVSYFLSNSAVPFELAYCICALSNSSTYISTDSPFAA